MSTTSRFTTSTSKPKRPARVFASVGLATTLFAAACGSASTQAMGDQAAGSADNITTVGAETDGSATFSLASSDDAAAGSLFDATSVHSIEITFDDTTYADMLAEYIDNGEKEWIEATVTIDGSTYEQVGLRLKGNSSLFGLSTDAAPEELPWLIRLDKFVDDQNHEGYVDLVVRSNNTTTALNEAVALELLGDAGLATEQAIAIGLTVNGSNAVLRLVVEHPDDVWMAANFSEDGALYKAESGGDYSYRGDDPDSYDEIFDQEAGKDNTDLTPLSDFLEFINDSDDETFADELDDWLDVGAFANYLAMMDLVDNFDDIDGRGNNSYLYYDTETEQFTVVPWDLNLAFGVKNEGGGPGVEGAGGGAPGEFGQRPAGGPPAGGEPPTGAMPGEPPTGAMPGGGGPQGSNVLAERFTANDDFNSLYGEALEQLDAELFASGHAQEVLDQWTDVLETSNLVDTATLTAEASAIETNLV